MFTNEKLTEQFNLLLSEKKLNEAITLLISAGNELKSDPSDFVQEYQKDPGLWSQFWSLLCSRLIGEVSGNLHLFTLYVVCRLPELLLPSLNIKTTDGLLLYGMLNSLGEKCQKTSDINLAQQLLTTIHFKKPELQQALYKSWIKTSLYTQDLSFFKALLNTLESEEIKLTLYKLLITESFNTYNIPFLQQVVSFAEPVYFKKAANDLGEKNQEKLNQFLKMDSKKGNYIHNKMSHFLEALDGKINYEDTLLTLAQRKARKDYSFEPVLIMSSEFCDFIKILASAPKPISQTFIMEGSHFITGEIEIDKGGIGKLFINDSLGVADSMYYANLAPKFASQFPKHEIYHALEKRHHSRRSACAVFALDDIAHSHNYYLEAEQTLWHYLATKSNDTVIKNGIKINICPVPLTFIRSMESRDLFKVVLTSRSKSERCQPINKKFETVVQSARKYFKEIGQGYEQNTRILYKMERMNEHNWEFLNEYKPECIEELMKSFTLAAFKEKITTLLSKEVTASSSKEIPALPSKEIITSSRKENCTLQPQGSYLTSGGMFALSAQTEVKQKNSDKNFIEHILVWAGIL